MRLIRQKHECGCVVACLAMVLRLEYDEVLAQSKIDPEYGAYRWEWIAFLRKHHYRGFYREFDINAAPPKPWAALHFCSVYRGGLKEKGHMVLVYRERDVYDPDEDQIYHYNDLSAVRMLAAIYPPPFMQARLIPRLMER